MQNTMITRWWWNLRLSHLRWLMNKSRWAIGDEAVKQVRKDADIYAFVIRMLSRIISPRLLCKVGLHTYRDYAPELGVHIDLFKCNKCGEWCRSLRKLQDASGVAL